MASQLRLRRGTTAQHSTFTGASGEVTVDTTKNTAVVHNGSTAGGFPLARENLSNVPAGSVTTAMLADGSVTAAKIADLNVGTADIADAAVTTAKIADGSVTSGKIADGAVATADIADGAVTTAKVANTSVTVAKLSATGTPSSTTFLRGDGTWASAGGVPALDDIGSVCMLWYSGSTNVIAGGNVSGSLLFRLTTVPGSDSGFIMPGIANTLQLFSYFGVTGNQVGRTTAVSGNSRTASPVSGTWRVLNTVGRASFEGCFNSTFFNGTLAVRVA